MPDQKTPTQTLPLVAIVAALFCFSAGPVGVVVQRFLVAEFSPFLIVAVQMTIGAVVLWGVRQEFPAAPVQRSAILKGLMLGLIHPGGFFFVYTAASGRLDSVTAVLLLALVPALVAVGGRLALKEELRPIVLLGIFAAALSCELGHRLDADEQDAPKLAENASDHVHNLGALSDDQVACPMNCQHGLLVFGFDLNEPHSWAAYSFADGFGISGTVFCHASRRILHRQLT